MSTEKPVAPPYVSFKTFMNFMNVRRDEGHTTTVVDKSLMSNLSGSTANELLQAIKYLGFVKDSGEANTTYEEFALGSDDRRATLLNQLIRQAYPYVWNTTGFDLERATSAQMTDLFREQNINGSTLSRAVLFFLSAAQAAGIKVSPNIKAQPRSKSSTPRIKKEREAATTPVSASTAKNDEPSSQSGGQSFEIPIPINRKVRIHIPPDWSSADWDLFQQMLGMYITGWKALMPDKTDNGNQT